MFENGSIFWQFFCCLTIVLLWSTLELHFPGGLLQPARVRVPVRGDRRRRRRPMLLRPLRRRPVLLPTPLQLGWGSGTGWRASDVQLRGEEVQG